MSDAGNGEFANFSTNPLQKLFWSQDVAMMTESFIRTALRNGLNLTTRCKPAPL